MTTRPMSGRGRACAIQGKDQFVFEIMTDSIGNGLNLDRLHVGHDRAAADLGSVKRLDTAGQATASKRTEANPVIAFRTQAVRSDDDIDDPLRHDDDFLRRPTFKSALHTVQFQHRRLDIARSRVAAIVRSARFFPFTCTGSISTLSTTRE